MSCVNGSSLPLPFWKFCLSCWKFCLSCVLCSASQLLVTLHHLLPLQSSLNKNGLTTTGVYVASSEAAVKQAGNVCQNGAINGICIGELDNPVLSRPLLSMLRAPRTEVRELHLGSNQWACGLCDTESRGFCIQQGTVPSAAACLTHQYSIAVFVLQF